ncbi:hypothetical protein GCM10022207_55460 [Streptomyces lannensis]|uniref:Uncharacterized protein n=1 Tax=Streptomyces lannensis TaxID=766498 RepID=A0ABP7KL30_9ACTN
MPGVRVHTGPKGRARTGPPAPADAPRKRNEPTPPRSRTVPVAPHGTEAFGAHSLEKGARRSRK